MPFGVVGRSDGSRHEAGMGLGISPRVGVLLGANLGRTIVTSGDFTAYVCDSAATRPSSQITLGRLVTHRVYIARCYVLYNVIMACIIELHLYPSMETLFRLVE